MQVFVNKSGDSTEIPASPSLSLKSFNGCSLPNLCSTPKSRTSVQPSSTLINDAGIDDKQDTKNDADYLEDQDSLSEPS